FLSSMLGCYLIPHVFPYTPLFRSGVHTAFSGNHRHLAEQVNTGRRVLGGGELLLPGEVRLEAGERYQGPWLYASYGEGLDAVASDRKSTRLNSSHVSISYAVFCLK